MSLHGRWRQRLENNNQFYWNSKRTNTQKAKQTAGVKHKTIKPNGETQNTKSQTNGRRQTQNNKT